MLVLVFNFFPCKNMRIRKFQEITFFPLFLNDCARINLLHSRFKRNNEIYTKLVI